MSHRNCGCSGASCGCQILGGTGTNITGIGTIEDPYLLSVATSAINPVGAINPLGAYAFSTWAPPTSFETYVPFYVMNTMTSDAGVINVTTAQATNAGVALYNSNPETGSPDQLQGQGTVSTSTTGKKAVSWSGGAKTLIPGLYWIGVAAQATGTLQLRAVRHTFNWSPSATGGFLDNNGPSWRATAGGSYNSPTTNLSTASSWQDTAGDWWIWAALKKL